MTRPVWALLGMAGLVARLRGRGLTCRMDADVVLGEQDLRLCIHRPDGAMTVELLGPAVHRDGWQAVRVAADCREVWLLPVPGDHLEEAVALFVSELLTLPVGLLAHRYCRLS